ncbi:4788_t:CDS:2, partial [Racocetra fulgida]
PFIGLSSRKVHDYDVQQIFPKHRNNIQELEIQYHIYKKIEFGRLIAQLDIIKDQVSNNTVRLINGCIYNTDDIKDPLVRRDKGRPATKHLKAFTEENNMTNTSNMRRSSSVSEEKGIG